MEAKDIPTTEVIDTRMWVRWSLANHTKIEQMAAILHIKPTEAAQMIVSAFSLPAWLLERSKQAAETETEKQAA